MYSKKNLKRGPDLRQTWLRVSAPAVRAQADTTPSTDVFVKKRMSGNNGCKVLKTVPNTKYINAIISSN